MAQKEAYAVLSDDGKTVTFYYDDQKGSRSGVVEINNTNYGTATKAVIDVSFKEYRPTSTAYWFQNCSKLTSIFGMENLNTAKVTNMSGMFSGCFTLTSLDVSKFNTANVTNMSYMFRSCSALTSLDVSKFNTAKVTDMREMFYNCLRLTSLDVSKFNTANVTDMRSMFDECKALTSLDLSNFNTANVTNMNCMFSKCQALTSLDLSNFNTEKVTIMVSMFYGCYAMTSLDLSNFNTEKITDMQGMFSKCQALKSLDVSSFKTDNVTNMIQMFDECQALTSLDVSNFNTENVTYMSYMFSGCQALTSLDVSNFNTANVTNMNCMFRGCQALTSLDVSNFNTANVTDMGGMFVNCQALPSIDVSKFNTVNVTSMSSMFSGCQALTSLDVSKFNTENVTYMNYMFSRCKALTSLDVSNFNTAKVTSMREMFRECRALTSLNVSNFNTAKVIDMQYMFEGCQALTSLDVSSFNTANVSNMSYMFSGCEALKTIYAYETKWSTAKVTDGSNMFSNCNKLEGGNGTVYDSSHTNHEYARIDKPDQPGYFTEKAAAGTIATLSVKDDAEHDITESISIVWYDGEGKQIGTGNKLNGVAEGAEVYYSVLLDESLGRVYREINMQKAEITEDEIILTCQLEKIGRVTLEGYVSATDIDKTTVTVSVQQMLNSKWQQDYSTQTDAQGKFSVEVYDDVTDITISGDGYLNTTIHRDGFGGDGNMGTIPVKLLTGFAIAANITIAKATTAGEPSEVAAWTDGLTNIGFSLTNMTKGTALTDIAVQNGNVVIKSGAAVGDEISLTAASKQGVFADATTTFTIAEGANRFDLELTELGGIEATCEASSNSTTVGYLYDHNDALAARGTYKGETLSLRHLKSGTYTLVTMGQSLLLGNLTSLNDLNAVGLSEGADYVTTRIEVTNGELTAVSVSEVPRMNETPFYYTTGNTYFNADKTSVTAGNYLTLRAHVDFKAKHADKANGVTLTIDLPEGCQVVDNSVIANRKAVAHTVNGNRVTIPLTKEQYESEVRFCVIPTLNQSYNVTAMASFDIGGQVQQPIGTAQFEAKGLSISIPKITESTLVTINGTAQGHSEVSIYDNDVFIGKTSSKADGRWTAQCELHKPYSHSFHDIYAKITTESGMELSSETQQVEYIKINIVPTTVTMLYYNPEYVGQYNIVFDLINGTTTPSSYYYFPYKNWPNWYETRETEPKDFTFLADFTRNDPTRITNVNIKVLNSDGTVRTLPATFNDKQGKWVATTRYASASRLPQNVTVEYDLLNTATEDDREEPMLDMATDIIAIANKMNESIQNNVALSLLEEEESKVVFEYKIKDFDDPMLYELEILDFATAKKMLDEHQFIFSEMDGDTIAVFTDYTNSSISTVNINMTEKIAFRTILYDNEANQQAIPARKASKVDMLRSLLLNPLNISKLTNFGGMLTDLLGIREYLSVGGDFKMMCQVIIQYQEKYSKTHQNAFNLLLSKCPDGSKKLSEEQIEKFNAALNALSDTESAFADQYYVYLQEYKKKLAASVLTFGLTSTLLQFVKVSKMFRYSKFNQVFLKNNFNKFMFYNASRKTVAEIFGNTLGLGINAATNIINNYKDFNSVRDNTLSWAMDEDNKIMSDYVELINAIKESYKDCNKKEDDETNDEPTDDKSDFNGDGTKPIIDPSGYVYEAVLSNRLEGVTTTCYEQQGGSAVLWNAADYSQQNPLQTDETGFYRWDVPQGMWQVKYEKEGYETAYSEWLPVPPPQLDVNIGMKQNTPPTVKQMRGHESGITVEMGKYMRPETMTAQNITVTRNGTAESGSIELLNTELAPLGDETYVSKVKFVPESGFNSTDVVVVTVHKEVESYCGVTMTGDHVETVKIEAEVKDIVADSAITVPYQGERELRVVVMPKGAAAGRKLHVKTSSAMIASVSAEEVTIDQDGVATLTVGGELPGGAVIDFSLDGTDITATSKVKVVMNREMVAMPVASIMSGSTIDGGTQIVLTCDTEGATIYYTLDGSCPCDEATRHKYDGPIAIATDVIVKAIAVKEGMDDSDIATFIYVVTGINGAQDGKDIDVKWFDGSLIVEGAEGSGCQIYDLQGRTLASRTWLGKRTVIAVPRAEVYVVSIQSADKTQTVIRKIMAR